MIGLDVGSTTVKAIVMDPASGKVLWRDYRRHGTMQPETLLDFLKTIEAKFQVNEANSRAFITGSGGGVIAPLIGARFVQEVNAISIAVERLHPGTGSIIELGGQDAKIIIWVTDEKTGKKIKYPSMNDKCAGGTGAVIDKIGAKLGFSQEGLQNLDSSGKNLHPVAGRCGVFAETDINSLQKQGVFPDELINSLFEAIVQQNLSVLTRGNVLMPEVLLLGGPHAYMPALADAWRRNIPKVWEDRNVPLPKGVNPADLIKVPDESQYFGAFGSIFFGMGEDHNVGAYKGTEKLGEYINDDGKGACSGGDPAFFNSDIERDQFVKNYRQTFISPAGSFSDKKIRGYLGIDGGSTSTKGVVLNERGDVVAKAYRLSAGNPLEDTKGVIKELKESLEADGFELEVCGVGTTGYAKDMLKEAIQADVAIVETVAHTRSALKFFADVDVICDVGGQDIKVILLNDGHVKDFKLNTQCSAGNGYFLQSTARQFGYDVTQYADLAFSAKRMPIFNYGCAVFLESDIVNFQQQGWHREEILAAMARVLPKNIWLYVVQEPNLKKLGKTFVLQGGTQKNLAAVKAQHDYIKARVPDATILVHPHTGESGAIGAAMESMGESSSFIGFEALASLTFSSTRNESTRCLFCKNKCMRTFIDLASGEEQSKRYIIAPCEKGTVEAKDDMLSVQKRMDEIKIRNPNLPLLASREAFQKDRKMNLPASFSIKSFLKKKEQLKIAIPRTLNVFSVAPFFIAYLEAIGIESKNISFSDMTNDEMFKKGSRRGSIDQCFPSKAAMAHIHNILSKGKADVLFFPIMINLPSTLTNTVDSLTCPTVQATPDVCKAAFSKDRDIFAEKGIRYVQPVLNMGEPDLLEHQMFKCFKELIGTGRGENKRAVKAGLAALDSFSRLQQEKGRKILDMLENDKRVGLVLLGRPYHSDPGLNHGIIEEIQQKGYPVLSVESLPVDDEMLDRLFGEEIMAGDISTPMDISDVWKNSYSENSNKKIWGAKYVARHPNLVALDLSNFKCGHDSPIFSVVDEILHKSGTPYFTFHDIDENKPSGSIKIRVETIDYFLKLYQESLRKELTLREELEKRVKAYEQELMAAL